METTRQQKVTRQLQKDLGEIFLLYARKLQGVLISVSEVRISPDLSVANVYLSVFPSEKATDILDQVKADVKSIRFELGNRVRFQLRIVPELRFYIDETLDKMEHIDELLKN